MKIEFFEKLIPPTTSHHSKKIVRIKKGSTFVHTMADTPDLVAAKAIWDAAFIKHRPPEPLDGPLWVCVDVIMPWLAGDTKKMRANGWTWHDTKPDGSNVYKTIEDSFCRCGLIVNDSRVVKHCMTKMRGDNPGVYVCIHTQEDMVVID